MNFQSIPVQLFFSFYRHTKHGVTKEKIRRMLENQDRYVTVQTIMASQPKSTAIYGVDVCQTHPTE